MAYFFLSALFQFLILQMVRLNKAGRKMGGADGPGQPRPRRPGQAAEARAAGSLRAEGAEGVGAAAASPHIASITPKRGVRARKKLLEPRGGGGEGGATAAESRPSCGGGGRRQMCRATCDLWGHVRQRGLRVHLARNDFMG